MRCQEPRRQSQRQSWRQPEEGRQPQGPAPGDGDGAFGARSCHAEARCDRLCQDACRISTFDALGGGGCGSVAKLLPGRMRWAKLQRHLSSHKPAAEVLSRMLACTMPLACEMRAVDQASLGPSIRPRNGTHAANLGITAPHPSPPPRNGGTGVLNSLAQALCASQKSPQDSGQVPAATCLKHVEGTLILDTDIRACSSTMGPANHSDLTREATLANACTHACMRLFKGPAFKEVKLDPKATWASL